MEIYILLSVYTNDDVYGESFPEFQRLVDSFEITH